MENKFLDFIVALSPAGETPLVVWQKPNSDGFTWPAFLPNKVFKPGSATYINTASFIVERFREGKISASAANATNCLFLVLDDVGTKSKPLPLDPTWVMETSPGNAQWGYVFSEQPTLGEFTAAIKALADAGYTDPGATNAVRNVRLPGSVNLKPGRGGFVSRLVEFHPDRDNFTLEQICAAAEVTPAIADTATHRSVGVQDDGEDDILAWVSERGDLLEHTNPSGWAGVRCPNAAEHTDGIEMGRYNPVNRAYSCMHAHCQGWNSERYLAWIAEHGGPVHKPGIRDMLMASIMNDALNKIAPNAQFPEVTQKIIKEVELRELGRVNRANWHSKFAYVMADNCYFDMETRHEVSRSAFDAIYRGVKCISMHSEKTRVKASEWFDEHRQELGGPVLQGVTYAPGESVLCAESDGMVYGNKWVNARLDPVAGDPSLWLRHVAQIVPEPFEREHLLNVMACKLQHPSVKINHAVLLGGTPGAGKDMLFKPFLRAVCGMALRNLCIVDAKVFSGAFQYYLESEIILVNELRPSAFSDRRELENSLKPVIAAPPDRLPVNRKNAHPYSAVNRTLVIAQSNYRDAIALPPDDRRWFVLWTYAPRMHASDASALQAWYDDRGYAIVANYLLHRDISAFNPSAAPAMTEAKALMSEQSMSPAESYILEQVRGRVGEFSTGVVGAPLHALLDRLSGGAPDGCKLTVSALTLALKEAGWMDKGRIYSAELRTKKQAFVAPELSSLSNSELRRRLEPVSSPGLRAVS